MKTTSTHKKSTTIKDEPEILHSISNTNLKQLQNIFQNAPAAIAIFSGPQHRFIMANLKYQKQNNRTENDLLGKTFQEVFPELNGTGSYEIFDKVYKTGETFTASEFPAIIDVQNNGNPTQCYFNFSLEALKNESDGIYGLMVMALDITDQVLANKKIEESEQRFRLATEASGVGIWEWNVITNQIKWDAKMFEIYGIKPTNNGFVQYNTWKEAVVPEDFEEQEKILQDTLKNSSRSKRSFKILREDDGVLRHIEAVEIVRNNVAGQAEWLVGTNIDITDQVTARKKIEENEIRFRDLVHQAPVAMSILRGKNFLFEMANEKHLQLLGKTKEQIMNFPAFDAIPESIDQGYESIFENVYKTGIPFVANELPITIIRNDKKETIYLNFINEPLYNIDNVIDGIFSIAIDVTEQVIARKKIEESEHKYQNLIYTSPYMIAIFKGKNLIIEIANDAILETWGKGKDVIGKSFYDVLPEAVEQGFHKLILNVLETGEPYHAYETPITLWRNESWELMHYNFIYQAQRNANGEIEGVAILANEVTPHVLDKMRIFESETRFRLLADNLPVSIFIADATLEDNITYVNKYWLDFTNQTFDVATNNGWFSTLHPDDKQLVMSIYEPAFKKREPYIIPNFRLKRFDGEYRWFTFQATPRYLPNGEFEGYMGAGFDITEQKLFELELIEQKIKAENAVQAKQQFLSNMSHEIRTPMNAIVGFTNVILKTELNDSQKQYLDAIKVSGDALVVLINDILDLAKVDSGKMTFEKLPFDLAECIHKIVL